MPSSPTADVQNAVFAFLSQHLFQFDDIRVYGSLDHPVPVVLASSLVGHVIGVEMAQLIVVLVGPWGSSPGEHPPVFAAW